MRLKHRLHKFSMTNTNSRNNTILFLSGFNLILYNFLLIHPVTIAVGQAEITVLIFTLAYFSGISFGYLISDKISLKFIRILFPWIFLIQLLMVISLPFIFRKIDKFFDNLIGDSGIIPEAILFLLIMIAGTSLYAVFLPRIINVENKDIKSCYRIEVIGSICGLLLIPVASILSFSVMVMIYFLFLLWIYYSIYSNLIMLIGLCIIGILFFVNFSSLDAEFSKLYYQSRMKSRHIDFVEHIQYTPYHKIEILVSTNGKRTLVLNGKTQFGESSHHNYSYFLAEYPAKLLGNPSACILGCGSMSTVGRIGDMCTSIQIVDLDEGVFNTSRKYFQKYNRLDSLDNWQFEADDAKHFLANNSEKYDLILHDIPPAKSRQIALTYTREFFQSVKNNLSDRGIFSISSLTPLNSKSQYGLRMMATLVDVFDEYFILTYKNGVYFYGGNETLKILDENGIRESINHTNSRRVRILAKDEIERIVKGSDVITVNNLRDLIFD